MDECPNSSPKSPQILSMVGGAHPTFLSRSGSNTGGTPVLPLIPEKGARAAM